MKILLINYEYPPIGAGAATATQEIARALVRQGHQPVVLTSSFGALRGPSHEEGVQVMRVSSSRRRREASSIAEMMSFFFTALPAVRGLVRREQISVMIAFFSIPCGPLAWWAARGTGVPYVVSLRGGDVPGTEPGLRAIHAMLAPFRRHVLRKAAAVIANSPGLKALSESADPVAVGFIPNGVDTRFYQPPPSRPGSTTFRWLFVGRFQAQKNLPWLLTKFAELSRAAPGRLSLDLVGDGPQRAALESLARELGIAGDLRWHGWLDRAALRAVYQAADGLINPSLYEGMPNVVLEAMASGLPVLASRVPGNDAVVTSGQTGHLFELGDARGFQACARAWADRPEEARRLGEAGRARAVAEFSWDTVAEDYLRLFPKSH